MQTCYQGFWTFKSQYPDWLKISSYSVYNLDSGRKNCVCVQQNKRTIITESTIIYMFDVRLVFFFFHFSKILSSSFETAGKSPVPLLCKFTSWFRSLGNIWAEFKDLLLWYDCLIICWHQQIRKNLTQAKKSSCIRRSTYKLCSCIKVYRLYRAVMCSSQYYTTEVSRPSLSNSNSQMTLNWCN